MKKTFSFICFILSVSANAEIIKLPNSLNILSPNNSIINLSGFSVFKKDVEQKSNIKKLTTILEQNVCDYNTVFSGKNGKESVSIYFDCFLRDSESINNILSVKTFNTNFTSGDFYFDESLYAYYVNKINDTVIKKSKNDAYQLGINSEWRCSIYAIEKEINISDIFVSKIINEEKFYRFSDNDGVFTLNFNTVLNCLDNNL